MLWSPSGRQMELALLVQGGEEIWIIDGGQKSLAGRPVHQEFAG